MSQVAKRDLRIDLLRIFSMLFIIMHHCIINDFGFKPSTSLRDGLRKFAEWYKEFYKN